MKKAQRKKALMRKLRKKHGRPNAYQLGQRRRRALEKKERAAKAEKEKRQRAKEAHDVIAAEDHGSFVLKTPSTLRLFGHPHLDLPKGTEITIKAPGRHPLDHTNRPGKLGSLETLSTQRVTERPLVIDREAFLRPERWSPDQRTTATREHERRLREQQTSYDKLPEEMPVVQSIEGEAALMPQEFVLGGPSIEQRMAVVLRERGVTVRWPGGKAMRLPPGVQFDVSTPASAPGAYTKAAGS